jgi:hypothetical protein
MTPATMSAGADHGSAIGAMATRRASPVLGCVLALLLLTPPPAAAVTLGEVVELTTAGVGDAVLVELIQMGNQVYDLSPTQLRALKGQGVSDHVLLALLRSGRAPEAPAADGRQHAGNGTADLRCLGPGVVNCPGVPALAPTPMQLPTARQSDGQPRVSGPLTALGFGGVAGFAVPVLPFTAPAPAAAAPVYWGWGGEKRPGSWNGHSER